MNQGHEQVSYLGANSFDCPAELQRRARELAASPAEWMPWNYRETLARI